MSDAQYKEGGGDTLPPYQEDYFQRIVNISWPSGVVCIACNVFEVFHGELRSKESQKWINVGDVGFRSAGGNICSSYALINKKSVFILAGTSTNDINDPSMDNTTRSVIMTSNDGKAWRQTYEHPEYIGTSSDTGSIATEWEYATGVVWDDQAGAFYFSVAAYKEILGYGFSEQLRLYRSIDGNSWSSAGETSWYNLWEEPVPEGAELIYPHCRKPQNRNQIPDGLQGYDKKSGTFMKPQDLIKVIPAQVIYANYPPAAKVFIDPKTGGSLTADVSGPCICVAGANGIWLAGGVQPTMLVSSFDNGKTWSPTGAPLSNPLWGFVTVIAAPMSEVKSGK